MTRNLKLLPMLALLVCLLVPAAASAHSALCSCFDNGDGTITCEGGFSDGSSAAGVRMFVRDANDTTVARGKMNEDGEFSFDKPEGDYTVIFDAGPGHQVEIKGSSHRGVIRNPFFAPAVLPPENEALRAQLREGLFVGHSREGAV